MLLLIQITYYQTSKHNFLMSSIKSARKINYNFFHFTKINGIQLLRNNVNKNIVLAYSFLLIP